MSANTLRPILSLFSGGHRPPHPAARQMASCSFHSCSLTPGWMFNFRRLTRPCNHEHVQPKQQAVGDPRIKKAHAASADLLTRYARREPVYGQASAGDQRLAIHCSIDQRWQSDVSVGVYLRSDVESTSVLAPGPLSRGAIVYSECVSPLSASS